MSVSSSKRIIYLDNAATTWPKPEPVHEAIDFFLRRIGASPGRSGHSLSIEAGRLVFGTREAVAGFFGVSSSDRVVFTQNATHAINLALKGILGEGDHVIVSSMEHNSMMRPLRYLSDTAGVAVDVIDCSPDGTFPLRTFEESFREETRLVAVLHASNVTGALLPIRDIGKICRRKGALFLVDAAQTAGVFSIDMAEDQIDLLAFTGHKGLLGPQGIGGLCLGAGVDVAPLMQGGTGSYSEHDTHPDILPDRYESGTMNTVGIAGLGAGIRYINERGLASIREHETNLTAQLIRGLSSIEGIRLHGPCDPERQIGVVCFTIDGIRPSDIGYFLDTEFRIMSRVGLHCSPSAHRTMGTFPEGTVRFSVSCLNEEKDVERAVQAVGDAATLLHRG